MTLQRKKKILEVSIESDTLYQPDTFMNATYESLSQSLILHNVYDPSIAIQALRRVRHVKHVIDTGERNLDDLMTVHIVKIIYDSDSIKNGDHVESFKKSVKHLLAGLSQQSHL